MSAVETLAHGNSRNLIMVSGKNPMELDTSGSTRPIFYFEERNKTSVLHVFCPELQGEGKWLNDLGVWSRLRRKIMFVHGIKKRIFALCPSPLKGAEIEVAWVQRLCKLTALLVHYLSALCFW